MFDWLRGRKPPIGPSAEKRYATKVREALVDALLSDHEWHELQLFAESFGLADAEARKIYIEIALELVGDRVREALADVMFSPEDERTITELAENLRIDVSFAPDVAALITKGQSLWCAVHGPMPVVPSPLGLRTGEVAHMWTTAEAFEERQRTRAVRYAGASISIPIVAGVRYRMGRTAVGRETYDYTHSHGVGTLVLTNKRLIFAGPKSTTANLTTVLQVEGFVDGVKVTRTTGKPQTYVYNENDRAFSILMARAWEAAL